MENILDHQDDKIKKQTFARLTLASAILTICSIIGMVFYIRSAVYNAVVSINEGMNWTIILFALAYVLLGFLSFVFSFITIYLKESWTLVKISGVALSGLIFLLFVAGVGMVIYANA